MIQRLALIGFGACCLLLAEDEPRQKVRVTHTEHMDFPSGGLLRLKNSIGDLIVEGWDRPDVEITTIKTTKAEYDSSKRDKGAEELDQVRLAVERHGDELVVTTVFPRHSAFSPPLRGSTSFELEYHVNVPQSARLVADHDVGEVLVDNLTGDVHVTVLQGAIALRLPEEGQYDIDARSKLGSVTSDFPGHERMKLWLLGHQFIQHASTPAHKLYLRVGYGDIAILKTLRPQNPAPLAQ
jgi:hypothetical protein